MNKSTFFKTNELVQVRHDDPEYGDFLLLHPEEISTAKDYESQGYKVYSVHETEDGEDYVSTEQPADYGESPYKYGYFVTIDRTK